MATEMQPAAVEDAAARGVRLIVSVDNGIRAGAAIARARELGIDVIVTDHHLPEADLPPALAVVNPNRRDCGYPNPNLCGAGVAFKLAHAILARAGWPRGEALPRARIVSQAGGDRDRGGYRAAHGREPHHREARARTGWATCAIAGLRALLDAAGFRRTACPTRPKSAFRIAPAINASGRMDSAGQAVRMFLTDRRRKRPRASRGELFALNQERQTAERAIVNEIFERCVETPVTDRRRGAGFLGRRLASRRGGHRGQPRGASASTGPAIVLGVENGVAQGSGRSIEAFHLLDALESMRELFTKFGGHAHAAGLTMPADVARAFPRAFARLGGGAADARGHAARGRRSMRCWS